MPRLAITPQNFWFWFGGLWLFVGGLFLVVGIWVGVHQFRVNDRLDHEGRTAEGMVLTKEIHTTSSKNSSSSSPTYLVIFQFAPVQLEIVRGRAEVTEDVWDHLEERGPISVTYLPDSPQSHRVPGQTKADLVLTSVFAILGGILSSLGGLVLFKARAAQQRNERLRRGGFLAEATITGIDPANIRINGVQQWKLRYRFQDAQSTVHEGSSVMSPEEAPQWQVGRTGQVRYDPRKPGRHIWIGKS
jgi:hypothetical protein